MNIRKLKKIVYMHKVETCPISYCMNFSLSRLRFDELRIYNLDIKCVIKEVVDNKAWIVYEIGERGSLGELSVYRKQAEAVSAFLFCLKKNNLIDSNCSITG